MSLRRLSPGRVFKGPLQSGYTRTSQPSIPSRYEQTLVKPHSPKDGFGLRAARFAAVTMRSPGPGQYSDRGQSSSPSFSQKGFLSGFVSEARRFVPKQFRKAVPGPGAYTPKDLKAPHNPAPGLVHHHHFPKHEAPGPGPADYYAQLPQTHSAVTNPFKSKTKRLENALRSDAPPPWHYHPDDKIIRSSSQKLTSIFRHPVKARRLKMNLYDPHQEVPEETTPGPGHYENPRDFDGLAASLNTSFSKQEAIRGLVEANRAIVPGPGAYTLSPPSPRKVAVSGSAFMSGTRRLQDSPLHVPGPAFYAPFVQPKKRSYLLNTERKWV